MLLSNRDEGLNHLAKSTFHYHHVPYHNSETARENNILSIGLNGTWDKTANREIIFSGAHGFSATVMSRILTGNYRFLCPLLSVE